MVFHTFFIFSLSCNKEFVSWATVSFLSCFCWLYRASPILAAKIIINLILVLTIWWCPCVQEQPDPYGKSCSWIVNYSRKCQKKRPGFVSHSLLLPYPYALDKSQFLQKHSAEAGVICRCGDPKKEAGGGNPAQSTWRPVDFSNLLACPLGAIGLHFFTSEGPTCIWRLWVRAEGNGHFRSQRRFCWLVHPPQLHQAKTRPSVGPRLAQPPGHNGLREVESGFPF